VLVLNDPAVWLSPFGPYKTLSEFWDEEEDA
jgi:hypothetical protein